MKVTYDLKKQKKIVNRLEYFPYLILGLLFLIVVIYVIYSTIALNTDVDPNRIIIDEYFGKRKGLNLSALGEYLYLNRPAPEGRSRSYRILTWKDGPFLERRHLSYFTKTRHDPFEGCSVNNCNITYDSDDLDSVDAVIFFLQRLASPADLPNRTDRLVHQRWIFLTDQSPFNTFQFKEFNDWRNYSNVFNWSMTYKMEADVPVPYGRTLPMVEPNGPDVKEYIPNYAGKRRDVLVAVKTIDCPPNKRRTTYVTELQKYLSVDVYGKCSNVPEDLCSRMSDADCPKLNNYLFYLSFENSNCDQFITENLYWAGYKRGAVPVIMGPTMKNCEMALPPNSYLHVDNFTDVSELAEYILELNRTEESYLRYHEWRRNFKTVDEHGYYGEPSKYYCRVCEALNYNDEAEKVYSSLEAYLDAERNCGN